MTLDSRRRLKSSLALGAVLALGAGALLAGCPDPAGDYDAFVKRTPVADASMVDAAASSIYDVTGRFLLGISTPISPDTPLLFISNQTLTPLGDGTATLELRVQALRTTDLTPLDTVYVATGTVSATGQFSLPAGSPNPAHGATGHVHADPEPVLIIAVPGEANPISGGDIVADLRLDGTLISADRMCGTIVGRLLAPFMGDLTGSKWGGIRVPAGAVGTALPAPVVDCPAQQMDAGVVDSGVADADTD